MLNKLNLMKIVPRGTIFILLFIFLLFNLGGFVLNAEIYYPTLNAKSNLLMDADTGIIFINDNIDKQLAIASLTKLMSVYVVLDEMDKQNIKLTDEVTISNRAAGLKYQNPANSGIYLKAGDKMTYDELLQLSLVYSDNGAIVALSEDVSGSEEKHVEKMNEKAKELHMTNTKFYNVTGLTMRDYGELQLSKTSPNDYNVSSARDMGILSYNLLQDYPQVLDYTAKTSVTYEGQEYSTYNYMLPGQLQEYKGVKGLKTGTTKEAGECFIGYYTNDKGENFISVVLNADSDQTDRFTETAVMYDWINEQFMTDLLDKNKEVTKLNIQGDNSIGKIPLYSNEDLNVIDSDNLYLTLEKAEYNPKYFDSNNRVKQDIPKGSTIITYYYQVPEDNVALQGIFSEDDEIQVNLVAHKNINKQNDFVAFFSAIPGYFKELYNQVL